VDIDAAKIAKIKSGEMPIFEPGLKVVLKNIAEKRLILQLIYPKV
jgi:UDPglucose 6-dehydrogenase